MGRPRDPSIIIENKMSLPILTAKENFEEF